MYIDIIGIIIIAVISVAIALTIKRGGKIDKNAAGFIVPVVLCGILLHATAIIHFNSIAADEAKQGFFIGAIESIFCTLKMFTLRIEIQYIIVPSREHIFFGIACVFVYFSAAFSTVSILFSLLMKSVINTVMVKKNSKRDRVIVIGNSEYVNMFVDDVKNTQKRAITVITDINDDIRRREWYNNNIGVLSNTLTEDVLTAAGIFSLKNKVDVVCLFENDEDNIDAGIMITDYMLRKIDRTANTILKERLLKQLNLTSKMLSRDEIFDKLNFTCNIMYKNIDRAENFRFAEKMLGKIRFFNIYDIISRKFIHDNPITMQIPPEYIDKKTATITSQRKIVNVFVGFNETGKHLLIKNICNNQMLVQDFVAEVFDKNIIEKEQALRQAAAGIFGDSENDKTKHYIDSPVENNSINFNEMNVSSKEFFDKISDISLKSDFTQIIVALENENLGIETALKLRQVINEIERNERTRIFVKVKSEKITNKVKLFNEGFDKNGKIDFFGNENEILTYDVIVGGKMDDIAMKLSALSGQHLKNMRKTDDSWNMLSIFSQDIFRLSAIAIRVKLNLIGLDIKKADTGIDNDTYFNNYFAENELHFKDENNTDTSMEIFGRDVFGFIAPTKRNNLARLEQLRYSVVHLVNGWTKMPIEKLSVKEETITRHNVQSKSVRFVKSDDKLKQNACVTTFEGLEKLAAVGERLLKQNNGESRLHNLISALINYNYRIMDNLPQILQGSGYAIVNAFENNFVLTEATEL